MKSVYFYNNRRVPASKQKRKLDHSHSFGRSYEHSNSVFPTFHSIQEVLYLNFVFRCRSSQTGSLSLLRSPRTWRNSHCRGRKLTSTSEIRTTDRKTENKEHHSLAERRKKTEELFHDHFRYFEFDRSMSDEVFSAWSVQYSFELMLTEIGKMYIWVARNVLCFLPSNQLRFLKSTFQKCL